MKQYKLRFFFELSCTRQFDELFLRFKTREIVTVKIRNLCENFSYILCSIARLLDGR